MRILKLRWLAVALLASALSGCVTVENKLTKADVATFKLAEVRVSVAPDAKIVWYEPLQAYAAAKKIPDEQYAEAIKTNEAKAHLNGIIAGKIKDTMTKQIGGALAGARPVRVEVKVTSIRCPDRRAGACHRRRLRHDRRCQPGRRQIGGSPAHFSAIITRSRRKAASPG